MEFLQGVFVILRCWMMVNRGEVVVESVVKRGWLMVAFWA
jgi:hypothetical protein